MYIKQTDSLGFDFRHYSEVIGRDKRARVIVPSEEPPEGGWHVCLLLHAFGGNRLSWLQNGARDMARLARTSLLVFPESGRRWFIDDAAGYCYETYLIKELLPALSRQLSASVRTDGAIIGGFSMGGAAAVSLALRHPHLFAAAYSYSGAFFASRRRGDPYAAVRGDTCMMPTEAEHDRVWGSPGSTTRHTYDPVAIIRGVLTTDRRPELVLEVGAEDYPRIVNHNRHMHTLLSAAGLAHTYREVPGDHTWPSALRATEACLSTLMGNLRRVDVARFGMDS